MNEWLQQLSQSSQTLLQAVVELLVTTIPMPWRVSATVLLLLLLINLLIWRLLPRLLYQIVQALFWLVELIVAFLLLPEYIVTRQLRTFGWGPLWGSYLYGAMLGGVVQLVYVPVSGIEQWQRLRFPWVLSVLLIVLPLGLWYARPSMEGMSAARYIDVGFQWWYGMESWMLEKSRL